MPFQILNNQSLAHFWKLFFHDKDLVRWSIFEARLLKHLSSPLDESETKESSTDTLELPLPPYGYGLSENEIFKIFYFKNKLFLNNIRNSLDYFNTNMISIATLASNTNHLPENLELKLVLFYLSSQMIKTNLPLAIPSPAVALELTNRLKDSYSILVRDDSSDILLEDKHLFTPFDRTFLPEVVGSNLISDQITHMLTHKHKKNSSINSNKNSSESPDFLNEGGTNMDQNTNGSLLSDLKRVGLSISWLHSSEWFVVAGESWCYVSICRT